MLTLALLAALLLPVLVFFAGLVLATPAGRRLADAGDYAVLTAEQVTDLGQRAKDLTQSCLAAVTKVGELRSKPADQRGDTYTADVRSALDELHANDAMHQAVTRILRDAAAEDERSRSAAEGRGPKAGTGAHNTDGPDTRSLGQRVVDDENYTAFAERGAQGHVEVRALLTTSSSDTQNAGLFMPRGTPFLEAGAIRRRRLFIRDVLSTGTTGLNSVPYIRETAAATNEGGATTVAEGAAKPEVTLQFTAADAPVRKIAGWLPVTTEIIADAPTLRSYIDARLEYMILLREEEQVLTGTGTAPNLLGIRNAPGLQTVKATGGTAVNTAGDNLTTIATGIRLIELVDGEADGLAINPTDFWAMLTRRASGDNHYDLDPFMSPERMQPWGVPPVRTRSLPAGTAIVGNWSMGATLLEREGVTVRVGDQHSDFFTNNKVAVLAEERVAFPIHRPDFFAELTFA